MSTDGSEVGGGRLAVQFTHPIQNALGPMGVPLSVTESAEQYRTKVEMFLAGDPMDPDREIPTQTKWEREGW